MSAIPTPVKSTHKDSIRKYLPFSTGSNAIADALAEDHDKSDTTQQNNIPSIITAISNAPWTTPTMICTLLEKPNINNQ